MSAVWQYFRGDQAEILGWLWTTIWLAALPLVVALLIALPLGWVAGRFRWTYPPIVTLGGVLYTVPSIVAFVVLPGVLHTQILAPVNVAVALTIYSVALLVRVVADGLSSVSSDVLSSASAMGYTNRQRLLAVQFPIAVPVIGAGLRVAAVSNVSLVSVASTIGVSQLGQLFVAGDNNTSATPIILGLIMFVLLALIFDGAILIALRLATPWRRA